MIVSQITALQLEKAVLWRAAPVRRRQALQAHREGIDASDLVTMQPQAREITKARAFSANSGKSSWGCAAVGGGVGGGRSISKSLALDRVARDNLVSSANDLAGT